MIAAPILVGSHNGPWPLHDTTASRAAEAAALATHATGALMARAGLSAARLVLARWPRARKVLVLAGPGNNGGDGWVLAEHLHRVGQQVDVWPVEARSSPPADARAARAAALVAGVQVLEGSTATLARALSQADLVVDALLGLGTTRPAAGRVADALQLLKQSPPPALLALDLPSGLDIDTGQPWSGSPDVPAATATLSLLTLKPGLFTGSGHDLAGEVWFDDLSCIHGVSPTALLGGPSQAVPAPHAWHKGSRGDVWVVGGDTGMDGAAQLAAMAALRGGAGRVLLHVLAPAPQVARAATLLQLPVGTLADAGAAAEATVVAGCGGGSAVASHMPGLLAQAARLVIDADGLNAIARDGQLRAALHARTMRGGATVLTPHPLEAARLLNRTAAAVQADRIATAQHLSEAFGCTVVLKGSGSVIAAPAALARVNPSGNAALATAGTGDVLAGWIAARWSQSPMATPQDVVAEAVWVHGTAADDWLAAGHTGPLLASELADWMGRVAAR